MKPRDAKIDVLRGIAVLSVVFIHTAYCSGGGYVPQAVRNISLIFDIDLFFFATGLTIGYTNKINVLKQYTKITEMFLYFCLLYSIITFSFNSDAYFSTLLLNTPSFPSLEIVGVSYWFIPVYIICLLVVSVVRTAVLIRDLFIILVPLYYGFSYFYPLITVGKPLLGMDVNMILYYSWLIIFAEFVQRNFIYMNWKIAIKFVLMSISLIVGYFLLFFLFDRNIFELQVYKFPTRLPYILITLAACIIVWLVCHCIKPKILIFLGKNAFVCYLAQGVSSSLIGYIQPELEWGWKPKFAFLLSINYLLFFIATLFLLFYFKRMHAFFNKVYIYAKLSLR